MEGKTIRYALVLVTESAYPVPVPTLMPPLLPFLSLLEACRRLRVPAFHRREMWGSATYSGPSEEAVPHKLFQIPSNQRCAVPARRSPSTQDGTTVRGWRTIPRFGGAQSTRLSRFPAGRTSGVWQIWGQGRAGPASSVRCIEMQRHHGPKSENSPVTPPRRVDYRRVARYGDTTPSGTAP